MGLFDTSNPLLHRMDAESSRTGRIFELARKIAEEAGAPIDFIDIAPVREHRYSRRINKGGQSVRRKVHATDDTTMVQWMVHGLSEKQFSQIEGVVRGIKSPYPIRAMVDEHGRGLPPGYYPNITGTNSTKRRGYFIGRKPRTKGYGLSVSRGIWATMEFKSKGDAGKEMRKSGWLFGKGSHLIELREDKKIKHLTFMEYVTQISRILAGKEPLPRQRAIYSSYRDLACLDIPPKSRDQIVGLDNYLDEIKWLMWSASRNPTAAEHYGVQSQSVLLAGVPGVGKTLVAEVLLGEDFDSLFIPISANLLVGSKAERDEYGEEEGNLFGELDTLQSQSDVLACLYCDDVESAMLDPGKSTNILSEQYMAMSSALLNRLAGMQMNPNTRLSGSSNDPSLIDHRFLQFGRIGYVIHIPLPGEQARAQTFEVHTRGKPLKGVKFIELVRETDGYTNRDIAEICNSAARYAMRRAAEKIAKPGEDIFDALQRVDEGVMADTPITQVDFEKAYAYVNRRVNVQRVRDLDSRIAEFCEGYKPRMGFGR